MVNLVCGRYPLFNSSATRATLPYGRGQWSNGRIPLPTALIPAAANRKAVSTVAEVAEDVAAVAVQAAGPSTGRRRDGGGPPIPVAGHVVETSVGVAKAPRQGSEARGISRSRVR